MRFMSPLPASAKKFQSLGIGSVVFDPCGNKPEKGDFLAVMRRNADRLLQAVQ